jgi:penicillin-binding protein 1C
MKRALFGLCLALAAAPGIFIAALEVSALGGDFPEELLARRQGSVEIRDRQGRLLHETLSPGGERARWVDLGRVSPNLAAALIAAEDERFSWHSGVDYRAIAHALWRNLTGRRSGASTLTQQLVKLCRPLPRTWSAKWSEAVLALRLERRLTKAQILEEYVNRASFAPGAIGVEAASWRLFDKPAAHLSLGEAALLAGAVRSPERYHAHRRPAAARARRDWVLGRMEALGFIDARERDRAAREPLPAAPQRPPFEAPHFVARLARSLSPAAKRVETTLDLDLQRRVESLVRRTAQRLRRRGGTQAAVVVLENTSGDVLAYVGSADWRDPTEGRNDGVQARRQPGSTLKPFAYALAFERGMTPATLLADLPPHLTAAASDVGPRNYDGRYHGPVLAREALANSYNVPAVEVTRWISPAALLDRLRALGMQSLADDESRYGLGIVLGNGEVTLYELARAYLALARGGERIEPRFLRGSPAGAPERVLSEVAAYLVTSILSDAHARQAAFGERSALDLPFPAAVKTGTSTDYRDNWTVGYTTEVTVAVWVGSFSGAPMRDVSGLSGAAPLWNEVVRAAMEGRPRRGFAEPAGIAGAPICALSGKRAGPRCEGRRWERFPAAMVPRESCDMHVAVEIDRRSGLLAGSSCPSTSRLGERYPARFAAWAAAAGRPVVPVAYAPGCTGGGPPPRLRIASPRDGEVFVLTPDLPRAAQRLALEALVRGNAARVRWTVDGREVGEAGYPYTGEWTLVPGAHVVVAEAGEAKSPPVWFIVRE